MATVNEKSLRKQIEANKREFVALCDAGRVSSELRVLFNSIMMTLDLLVSILLEKTTKKTSKNASIPPSQSDEDTSARRKGKPAKKRDGQGAAEGMEKVTHEETIPVETCADCGADLSDVEPAGHERRVVLDIVFRIVEQRIEAEIKHCPFCRARTKGTFPQGVSGPLQYGPGLQAFVINLLIAHMLSLGRAVALVKAVSGQTISEASCLKWIWRLHEALQPWEDAARGHFLKQPALHVDETGMRVKSKTWWLHVVTDGTVTLKHLHRKRGREAMDDIDIIPRYRGVLIHDCWASYFVHDDCDHALCGSHLLRELTFIVDSNAYRWARLMKGLLQRGCRTINRSKTKAVSDAEYLAFRRQYRTILTRGEKEMPAIPERRKGQRGRIAKSDAHNLHERLRDHEEDVLRFMKDPYVSYTNNVAYAYNFFMPTLRSKRPIPGQSASYLSA